MIPSTSRETTCLDSAPPCKHSLNSAWANSDPRMVTSPYPAPLAYKESAGVHTSQRICPASIADDETARMLPIGFISSSGVRER
ncbi:hypothetical protein PHSY_003869 [Pseudozyma hubeiensis SY62]|uniref:Uncharacterized protein n=1 Tax=Pseudozyma hubeiensis (strain SY62) TaxID=1305764 RepID=R9P4Q9_PSEHS|nr:hypothetical protein PHSY_003869 [Pseudozyma hubeiensis SY62]GAC96289.1 hypothetical protein PHSY_003869 [Pseudozyma hubeiensis SY62]